VFQLLIDDSDAEVFKVSKYLLRPCYIVFQLLTLYLAILVIVLCCSVFVLPIFTLILAAYM